MWRVELTTELIIDEACINDSFPYKSTQRKWTFIELIPDVLPFYLRV